MTRLARSLDALKPRYDAIVVGSGYGGGVAAARLARAGKRVAVLERGREIATGEFPRRFPELRWLDHHYWVPPVSLAVALGAAGLGPFVWGFVVPTVCLYHATFAINSAAHLWGTRRFATADDSRNNALLALLTLGEGWHNNHHHCMSSARQGLRWWEIDLTYAALRVLAWFGIARDLRPFIVRERAVQRPAA